MLLNVFRTIGQRVRIPTGNSKTNLSVTVPERKTLDTAEFTTISQEYFFKIKKALETMKLENSGSKLDIEPSSIRFEIPEFVMNLERNFGEQLLQLLIGNGISHSYFYDTDSKKWVSVSDGHLLDEMLCRELTLKCLGYFNI